MSKERMNGMRIVPTLSLLWETAHAINALLKLKGSKQRVTVDETNTKLIWRKTQP